MAQIFKNSNAKIAKIQKLAKVGKNKKKFNNKKFTLTYSTKSKDWKNKIIDFVNTKGFIHFDAKLKREIQRYLKKDFLKFLSNNDDKIESFSEWLTIKYPAATRVRSRNLFQNIAPSRSDKEGKSTKYKIAGSGNPKKFFITGEKTKIIPSRFKLHSYGITSSAKNCEFILHINVLKGNN